MWERQRKILVIGVILKWIIRMIIKKNLKYLNMNDKFDIIIL